MKKWGVLGLLMGLMFLGLAMASVTYQNNNLQTDYFGGEIIKGSLNISLNNEPASDLITSNFNGSIRLIDLIRNNSLQIGSDYRCNTLDCNSDYVTDSAITNDLSLDGINNLTFGFKILDDNPTITDINFSLVSDVSSSCGRQIRLVFPGNGMAIQNYRYKTVNPCSEVLRGCFNSGLGNDNYDSPAVISSNQICEKIHLPVAAAYIIGANIKNSTSGISEIKMQLRDNNTWETLGQCTLPQLTQNTQLVGCIVNYSLMEEQDAFVCISADSDSNYQIRTERAGDICGTGAGSYNPQKDYDLYAQALPFDNVNIAVNANTFYKFGNDDLVQEINSYLNSKYNGNCSAGCYVPFQISGLAQNLNIGSVSLKYNSYNVPYVKSSLYKFNNNDAKITLSGKSLEIKYANFSIPVGSKEIGLKLYVAGNQILSLPLNITPGFTFNLNPQLAFPGINTNFTVSGVSNVNLVNWDFGDNGTAQSIGSSVVHKYSTPGIYTLSAQVFAGSGSARLGFQILVGNPKEAAIRIINESDWRLANLTEDFNSYPAWASGILKDRINFSDMQAQLNKIKNDFLVASNDNQYAEVVLKLQAVQIPFAISSQVSGVLPIAVGKDKIDPSYMLSLSGDTGQNDMDTLRKAIGDWEQKNYNGDIEFKQIKALKDNGVVDLGTLVSVKISPIGEQTNNAYLIINYPFGAIKFGSTYGEKALNSGAYVQLGNGEQTFDFLIPSSITIGDLGMYITPEKSRLNLVSDLPVATNPGFNYFWFGVWIFVLIVVSLGVYTLLQEWYKKNYEGSLFKNRDDLYNLINFIYNSRTGGMNETEMKRNLSKSGWGGEQINYALKKIDGKRTGMYEIPLLKFRENQEVRAEIAKRQGGGVDARFIKRPNS